MSGVLTRWLLLVGFMTVAGPSALTAAESIVLPSSGPACKQTVSDRELNAWHCPGPAGYIMSYYDVVTRAHLSFHVQGRGKRPDHPVLDWAPAGSGIGSRIEWRMNGGKPFAAIIGRWRSLEEDPMPDTAIEELLIVKVAANGGCIVGTVGALSPGALAAARDIADARAENFRCGTDNPLLNGNAANGGVKLLDGRFDERETLEHNDSLVVFSHSASGAVEIRYLQPKPSLKVAAGTLLFRGQARGGEITGSAFLFKAGCEPAEYPVAGRRSSGVLVLEGNLPQRDPKSCAILASPKAPKPSRLVFTHESVMAAAEPETGRRVIAQCSQCMSATIRTIEGAGTERARIAAEVTSEDVRDHCDNAAFGATDRLQACLKAGAGDIGKRQEASANCRDLTVRPSSGGEYRFLAMGEDYGGRAPNWTNLADGKAECTSRSCNSANATAHFALLCPNAIKGWTGRH